jgi:hypothetical protein
LKSKTAQIELSHHKAERFYVKLSLVILIGFVLLVAVCWGGHDLYVRWQEKRLVRRALVAIQAGDERDASLAARTVLDIRPSSAAAARIMAQLAERVGDRSALDWRRKVAQLEPHSVEDALLWARCALQNGDVATAERVLANVEQAGRQTAGYHAVSALVAEARQQNEKADIEWSEAVRLAPKEKAYQLQLGTLRLRAHEAGLYASGEATLTALRQDPDQRAMATRALIREGLARKRDSQRLLQLARELQAYPEATLSDRLLLLDFLYQLQDPQFSSYLTELEKTSVASPGDLAALLSWMSQSNLNLLALDFVKSLPPETAEKWPVPLAVADIYTRLKDWRALERVTKTVDWKAFNFLRHAYLARALRGQDKAAAAEREWAAAEKDAAVEPQLVSRLLATISEWGWKEETTDLLWDLAKFPEKQPDALHTLYQHFKNARDTQQLHRILVRLAEIDPSDLAVKNNLAQIALLLDADVERARKLAAETYRAHPENPAYISTYAFALYRKGDTRQAVDLMAKLAQRDLEEPPVSAYYGIFLAAAGQKEKARHFLERGQMAVLLPEEKALVDRAVASINSP